LTRSFAPTIESLIFNVISLDYDDTLMAAAGEAAKRRSMRP
jgi:hydrogenase small subunit